MNIPRNFIFVIKSIDGSIDEDKKKIQSIPIFSLQALDSALEGMSNLRSSDEDGIVVEIIKYANMQFKEALVIFF